MRYLHGVLAFSCGCLQFFFSVKHMIFRSLLGKVMAGLADLSPVKNLIKYILDRTLNEFLSDQVKIEDFKDIQNSKLLLLTNISLNLDKINRQSLLSSPYLLHTGSVRQLKIKLPNWSELATRSIEVTVDGLMLDFKPNKMFAANFKEAMKQQQENVIIEQMEQPGEISQSNPLDFFRQLVKQMLLNMLIRIENIAVRLFINEPSQQTTAKPQYYLMFRMPLLTVGKADDPPHPQKEVEVVRFDVDLPQLSVHLLREGTRFPEFANQVATVDDYPFKYPSVQHPGTLLLLGQSNSAHKEAAKLRLTLTTNFSEKKKELLIEGHIGSIQATIDPIQLKIFSRFIAQIQQFQKVLQSVMIQLGLLSVNHLGISRQSIDLSLSRNNSGSKSHKIDLFSSMVMTISEPRKNKPMDLYNNLTSKPQLKSAANSFNQSACKQLTNKGEQIPQQEGYKHVDFKQEFKFTFGFGILRLNLLKYVSPTMYDRGWSIDGAGEDVNFTLGCSHFRGEMRELNYSFNTADNKHAVTMKYVTLHDVRLPNPPLLHHQSASDQFYDIDSSTFYNQQVNQDYFTSQPQLHRFKPTQEQHYCMEELLRVSDGACPPLHSKNIRRYAFMPDHSSGKGEGLMLIYNSHSKVLKVDVREVAVMANFELWKDMLNIVYPIFLYKQLASRININGENIKYNQMSEGELKFNPFESAYIFSGNLIEEVEGKDHPFALHIDVGLVYCLYRQTEAVKPSQNLINQVQNKIFDYDNFFKGCFCHLTERALYAQAQRFLFQKEREHIRLEVEQLKTGFLSLKDSQTNQEDIEPFLVVENTRVEQSQSATTIETRAFMQKSKFILELPELIKFIDMVKNIIGTVDSLLSFKRSLSSKIVSIDLQNGKIEKHVKQKGKKERVLQILAQQISLKTILISTYIHSLFFKKQQKNQEINIKSLAFGLINKLETSLGEFRHDLMLTTYPPAYTYPGIRDTLLLFQLGRQNLQSSYKRDYESKSKKKSKLQFFDKINPSLFGLSIFLKRKTELNDKKTDRYNEKKFQFNKNPKKGSSNNNSNIIEQQKYCKNVQILLGCPPHLHLGNIFFLVRQKDQLEKTIHQISSALNEIKRDSKEIISERKDSAQSIEEEVAEIGVKIKGGLVMIDIRPDFAFDKQKNMRVLSNTRLVAQLNLNKLEINLSPDTKQVSFQLATNLQLFFLHHLDRYLQTNPVFVQKETLRSLGFRSIAKIGEIVLKGDFSSRIQKGALQCTVDQISLGLCVSSLPALQVFSQHLLKHSIAEDFGIDEAKFETLQEIVQQVEILAIQQNQILEKNLEQKRKIQKMFQASQFAVISEPNFKGINVKRLHIMKISMNFYGGEQFKFIDCNSPNQSRALVRVHAKEPELGTSFAIAIDKFMLQAFMGEETKALLEFERLSVDYVFKRQQGLIWLEQKKYNWNIFKIERPLRVLFHLNQGYVKVKLNHLQVALAFTDSLFSLVDIYAQAAQKMQKSGWKKSYQQSNKEAAHKMLLAILPAFMNDSLSKTVKVQLSVELKKNKFLSDRILRLRHLLIHQLLGKGGKSRINLIIKQWLTESIKDNFGTLVTGALTEFIATCVQLLFSAIRHTFAFFVPSLRQ